MNTSNGILLTGINPSYDNNPKEPDGIKSFQYCYGRYWNPLKKIVQPFIDKNMVAYFDLFPLRVTKQFIEGFQETDKRINPSLKTMQFCSSPFYKLKKKKRSQICEQSKLFIFLPTNDSHI